MFGKKVLKPRKNMTYLEMQELRTKHVPVTPALFMILADKEDFARRKERADWYGCFGAVTFFADGKILVPRGVRVNGAYGTPPILDAAEHKSEEGWGYNPQSNRNLTGGLMLTVARKPVDPPKIRKKVYGVLEKTKE